MDQKSLERYIDRVIKLQEQRATRLSQDELDGIAADLGLSLEELRLAVDAHLQRGHGYMGQQLWDDAIKELREAEGLAPGNIDVLLNLARAHGARFETTDFVDDKAQAQRLAREVLELDPGNQHAFELLGDLERGKATKAAANTTKSPAKGGPLIMAVSAGVVLLFFVAGFVSWFVLGTRDASPPEVVIKEVVRAPDPVLDATEDQPELTESDEPPPINPNAGEKGSHDLELQVSGPASDKVEFTVRKSTLDVYTDSAFYGLKAVMKNNSNEEITKVDAVLELVDESGEVLHRDDPSLLWPHQPAMRPGDLSPVNLTERASAAVRGVRLTVRRVESTPGASSYPDAKPIEPVMGAKFGQHLKLETRERFATFDPGNDGSGYFKAVFELENKGETAIKELKLQLDLFGKDGEILETKTGIVAYSMTPAIYPGETWQEYFIADVENDYDRYVLTVTELQ